MAKDDETTQFICAIGSWELERYEMKSIKQFTLKLTDKNGDLFSLNYLEKSKFGNYYTFPE